MALDTSSCGKTKEFIDIEFVVHYLMVCIIEQWKIFGWISEDEQQALKDAGVVE